MMDPSWEISTESPFLGIWQGPDREVGVNYTPHGRRPDDDFTPWVAFAKKNRNQWNAAYCEEQFVFAPPENRRAGCSRDTRANFNRQHGMQVCLLHHSETASGYQKFTHLWSGTR